MRIPRLFTGRVLVLAVVTMLAFVLVFPTLRSYLEQRVELEQLNAQVAAASAQNDELSAKVARWSDNAYVVAQARERLSFVLPGESAYHVQDPETVPDAPAVTPPVAEDGSVVPAGSTEPWYTRIWDSVLVAGAAETGTPDDASSGAPDPSGDPASSGDTSSGDNGTAPADEGALP